MESMAPLSCFASPFDSVHSTGYGPWFLLLEATGLSWAIFLIRFRDAVEVHQRRKFWMMRGRRRPQQVQPQRQISPHPLSQIPKMVHGLRNWLITKLTGLRRQLWNWKWTGATTLSPGNHRGGKNDWVPEMREESCNETNWLSKAPKSFKIEHTVCNANVFVPHFKEEKHDQYETRDLPEVPIPGTAAPDLLSIVRY